MAKKVDNLDFLEESTEEDVAEFESRKQKKLNRACKRCIRNLNFVQVFWMGFMGVAFVLFFMSHLVANSWSVNTSIKSWKFDSWSSFSLFAGALILGATRLFSNNTSLRNLRDRKLYLTSSLPETSDSFMRELYLFYCKRRCVHFWLSFGIASMFALCILYSIVAVGVDAAAQWGSPKKCKLFTGGWDWKTPFLSGKSDDLTHKFTIFGLWGIIAVLIQFFVFRSRYTRPISILESKYGKDRIVDECMYCSKMSTWNFRYKSFAFIVVCLFGCLFYLLLKRLICILFDKSFVF